MRFVGLMALREMRSSWKRLLFFFICIAIGVGAIVALRSVIQSVRNTFAGEARSLIAADAIINSNQPLKPEVILMDEPCSALDVDGTRAIEELMQALRGKYTIVIVTHNMAQARRASDECLFMLMGELIEHSRTEDLFLNPKDPRTAEYIEGRYG